ncbi:hypothetical protein [Pararhodonellum marinum]|uniref:hypothetical protein n=1 Tax=Pararhodonellum marinum TaxID=2755358 RepID=UPI0018907172|nr:hypothetical protein [Pararhodonellum marinum]
MKTFFLLVFYTFALFASSYFLLDLEGMMINEIAGQFTLEILVYGLLDTSYLKWFSLVFTFSFLIKRCVLVCLFISSGMFFKNLDGFYSNKLIFYGEQNISGFDSQ